MLTNPQHHRWIYLAGLALVMIGLPLSKAMISIGEIILALNFFAEGNFKQKLSTLKRYKTIWFFAAVIIIHIISLLWTEDLTRGFKDIRIKAPLIIFPVIIGLSERIKRREFLWLVALFAGSVVFSSFASTIEYFKTRDIPGYDFREISLFTSHIRFALMVCVAYLILLNCSWNENKKQWLRYLYLIIAIWLSVFLFILQSMTGIVAWFIASYCMLLYTLIHLPNNWFKWAGISVLAIVPLITTVYVINEIDEFYPDAQADVSSYERFSESGEMYTHDTTKLMLENGNYVYHFQARGEMQRVWNRRSNIYFPDGKDANGNFIYTSVMRYLTSKGLRKDSIGLSSLSDEEIAAIESGITNVRFLEGNTIDNRIYTIIWEVDNMLNQDNPEGHSVTQRLEFWKTGWAVFKDHPFLGVGAGDTEAAYDQKYVELGSEMKEQYRMRAHNQYLSIAVATGVLGFVIFIVSLIAPFLLSKNANTFLYIGFSIVLLLSMLNEDTLETQAGVTLYAFFNAFFLYSLDSLAPKEAKAEE